MIFDFIFLSDPNPGFASYSEKGTDLIAGYVLEEINSQFFNFFFDPAIYKKEQRFCAALQSQVFEQRPGNNIDFFSESLAPLLFNSSYFTVNGNPLIIILADDDPGRLQTVWEILANVFKYLGYDNFYYCFIDKSASTLIKTNMAIDLTIYDPKLKEHDIKTWYSHLLEECGISRRLIFFFQPVSGSPTSVRSQLMNVEAEFRGKHPYVFSLLEDGADLGKRLEQYEISIQGLQKEIESRDAYISNLNIPETTLKRLSDFYHNEYEILPLWYKRFGHLIKVLMGKRSFRSLFDDKVKKYKD